jgi:hypothetical protein
VQELGLFVYLSEIGKQFRRSEILNKNECVAYLLEGGRSFSEAWKLSFVLKYSL